ncbi:serine/threonine-protein phosphatase [Cryobacterium frigoriphilum]|uniref:Serine/threonine-protein phosphatase n=1 Tax=Cryobacterium frigoriphilum TaxID=1259150 RepID=A0A4R8ZUN6_9MICO|nr:protein phosphatase 2C domain-containing protein [Cryobacterium frigoriphilum]TFD46343.1 serine/threonine-protein phosphatase [Cryobacterium frigoriphilum]
MPGQVAPIQVSVGAATDAGRRRPSNEDAFLASGSLYLVADGMGGHAAGEIASATVIDAFTALAAKPSATLDELRACVASATTRVQSLPEGAGAGAGTTLSGVALAELDGNAYWLLLNLGDSRTYRMAGGILEQISVDHSVVQELVSSGELTPAQAAVHKQRNVITRAIGAGSVGEPDYWMLPAAPGDRILVCSDGLTGELDDERIGEVLAAESEPQAAATRLVHEALLQGGRDNVTTVVVDALSTIGLAGDETLPGGSPANSLTADFDDTIPRGLVPRLALPTEAA